VTCKFFSSHNVSEQCRCCLRPLGLDQVGALKMQDKTLQDRTMTDKLVGPDIVGQDNDGQEKHHV